MQLSILRMTAAIGATALTNALKAHGQDIPHDGLVIWEQSLGHAYSTSYRLQIRVMPGRDFQVGMVRKFGYSEESDFIGSLFRQSSLSDAVKEAVIWKLDERRSDQEHIQFARQFHMEPAPGQQQLAF